MKKSRYTEEQIIATLKEVDAGTKVQDVIRKLGITEQTCYRAGARHPRAEGRRRKKMVKPAAYGQTVGFLQGEFEMSERRACRALGQARLSCATHLGPSSILA